MAGFLGGVWMMLDMPDALASFLAELSVVLILIWIGLGTLIHARPHQGLLWPQLRARVGRARQAATLDERDHYLRYRTFLTSYQLLFAALFAIVVLPGLLGPRLIQAVTDRFRGPMQLELLVVALLLGLAVLLPHWVLPWLERAAPAGWEAEPEAATPPMPREPRTNTPWIGILGNVLLWAVLFAAMLWIFRSLSPGAFHRLWG